ncbi:MAG TPA: hypothetical protein VF771_14415 [Longimicrobiaceae bacterium]
MKQTIRLAAALAAAAITLAACGDSTGNSEASPGSLSFSYTGARSGSYSATGAFRQTSDSTFAKQPFAVGARGAESGFTYISLLSYQPVTAEEGDMALFILPNVTSPATFPLSASCETADCPFAALIFDTNPDASEDDSDLYLLESGSVNVTSVSSRRMRGTFSGTATELFGDASITVTNGSFDVPLVSQGFFGAADRAVAMPKLRASRR